MRYVFIPLPLITGGKPGVAYIGVPPWTPVRDAAQE
jgi:hypothetical protein